MKLVALQNPITDIVVFLPEGKNIPNEMRVIGDVDMPIVSRAKSKVFTYQWLYKKTITGRLQLSNAYYSTFEEAKLAIFGSMDVTGIYLSRLDESRKEED